MAGYRAQGNTTVTYVATAITAYVNQADLSSTLQQIDVTTLGDTGKANIVDAAEWTINIGGPWHHLLDALIAPDAVTPGTKRNAVITYSNGTNNVIYTWTANAEVGNYNITSAPGAAIAWTTTLTLSGAPVRTTS